MASGWARAMGSAVGTAIAVEAMATTATVAKVFICILEGEGGCSVEGVALDGPFGLVIC